MSACGVCIGTDGSGYDQSEFSNEEPRVARKPHKCCECRTEIQAGERYWYICGKWDGAIDTFRQCDPCHEIQQVFSCGEGWLYGGLWESWEEADGFRNLTVFDPCFKKLSEKARQFLTARWWKWRKFHKFDHESGPPPQSWADLEGK